VQTVRIALAQIAPRLGSLEVNLATHHDRLREARDLGADLVVFPELGLTGYQLQDLAAEVAMRLDDPRLAELAAATHGMSAVVSFVEESADHRLFIAAALLVAAAADHFAPQGAIYRRRVDGRGPLVPVGNPEIGRKLGLQDRVPTSFFKSSKKPGYVFSVQFGSRITTTGTRRPTSARLIAMR
jgi:hypothetical protein